MVTIRVIDPTVRTMIITHLIEQLERGSVEPLLSRGVTPEMMDALRSLSTGDVLQLASSGHPDVHFTLDLNGFRLGLSTLERRKAEMQELAYFIQHGASHSMIAQFFPTTDAEVVRNIRSLLLGDRKPGRAALPADGKRDAIHNAWFSLKAAMPDRPLRARLVTLHGQFPELPLDALFATVNEFGECHAGKA